MMSKKIKIIVDEPPRIKPATSIGVIHSHVHTWNKSTEAKKTLQWKIKSALTPDQREFLLRDPEVEIRVQIKYFLPIPASASEKQKNLMSWGIMPHTSKPDADNLNKFHGDVGNDVLWPDDRQITYLAATQRYSPNPRTEYNIEIMDGMTISKEVREILSIYSPAEISSFIDDMWLMFEMYDTKMEIENTDDPQLLNDRLIKTAETLSRIARNHAKKLGIIAKKFPDLDIQNHKETAKGSDDDGN